MLYDNKAKHVYQNKIDLYSFKCNYYHLKLVSLFKFVFESLCLLFFLNISLDILVILLKRLIVLLGRFIWIMKLLGYK